MKAKEKITLLAQEYWDIDKLLKEDKYTIHELENLEDLLRCAVLHKIREIHDVEKIFWVKDDEEE